MQKKTMGHSADNNGLTEDRNHIGKEGRHNLHTHTFCILANALLSFSLPAFFISCTGPGHASLEYTDTITLESIRPGPDSGGGPSVADIFVFESGGTQRLDSYQRVPVKEGNITFAASGYGKKRIVAIVNPHTDRYSWAGINSYPALYKEKAALRNEDPSALLMSGETYSEAGSVEACSIAVSPVASEIVLQSIRCDFSDKPYREARLENAKVYLTNVSAEAPVLQEKGFMPSGFVNMYALDPEAVSGFSHPDILYRELPAPVGMETVYPGISLYCYPNECAEESSGSPYTRLVVEGEILGKKCYYPISINNGLTVRDRQGKGIGRNCRYTFDLTVRSMGSSDPDIEVGPAEIGIVCLTEPWNERDDTSVIF